MAPTYEERANYYEPICGFRKWTVDDGPVVWDDEEAWKNIEGDLDEDNTPQAAGTLRRFLEYAAGHLSDKLRARIEFHGDAQ